jgi:hypothetical protein
VRPAIPAPMIHILGAAVEGDIVDSKWQKFEGENYTVSTSSYRVTFIAQSHNLCGGLQVRGCREIPDCGAVELASGLVNARPKNKLPLHWHSGVPNISLISIC